MGVTFFNLKPQKGASHTNTKGNSKTEKTATVLLAKHETKAVPASFTYLDRLTNTEKTATERISKNEDGSYVMSKTTVMQHPIHEKEIATYTYADDCFSYKDKDGNTKVFNKLDTLKYDEATSTYTGIVEEIEYKASKVEVYTKND